MALALAAGPVALRAQEAQEVYQSVDAQGHVVFSDQPNPNTSAAELDAPQDEAGSPPGVIHVCWTNCFTLVGENGVYERTDGTDENWTVERFTPDAFVLKRHDAPAAWNSYHAEVTYAGQVANDRLINVTVNGRLVGDIQMSWGSALDSLPGSNTGRDQLAQNRPSAPSGEPTPDAGTYPATYAGSYAGTDAPLVTSEAPPPLPDQDQPACDEVGRIWTPGYWLWVAKRYYWIRGAWIRPPRSGLLWTPGYWLLVDGVYKFHLGFWGSHVGYYGGINYGHGYFGSGYSGGRWVNGAFVYNTAVSHVNTNVIRNVYHEPPTGISTSKVSYHGGLGGTTTPPPPSQRLVFREQHETPPARSMPNAAPQLAHVAPSSVERTPRNAMRYTSVITPTVEPRQSSSVAPRQSSSTARPSFPSSATRPLSQTRPTTALHPLP